MSSVPVFPPSDCSLLFHELVNFHMENNPTLPMFVYADDQASDHRTTEITFLEFGRAAHRIAHSLRPERAGEEGKVVILIANRDTVLFHTVVTGLFIAGLVVSVPAVNCIADGTHASYVSAVPCVAPQLCCRRGQHDGEDQLFARGDTAACPWRLDRGCSQGGSRS